MFPTLPTENFFSGALIARAAKTHKRSIQRRAARERWPSRQRGNQFEFIPPRTLLGKCRALAAKEVRHAPQTFSPPVFFEPSPQFAKAFLRLQAVLCLTQRVERGEGIELALLKTVRDFSFFKFSQMSLRNWRENYQVNGIAGLLENKAGRSGRRKNGRKNHAR